MTTGGFDLEILAADTTTWFGLTLIPPQDKDGNLLPKTLGEIMAASDASRPVAEALESEVQESWFRGVGLDYDWAPGVHTRDPDYACPAGHLTAVTFPGSDAGRVTAFAEYGGSIWVAQEGTSGVAGRVLRYDSPYTAAGLTASLTTLAVGEYVRGLCVGDDGSGNSRLYAFSSDGGTQNGRVHVWDGVSWTSTAAATFGTNGRGFTVAVQWRGQDGIRNNTMVTVSGPRSISYVRPNGDPTDPNDWIEGVKIATAGQIRDLAASRGHVWIGCDDNVFDLDEVGNTPSLLAYGAPGEGNGFALHYHDGSLFYSRGDGADKINVEQQGILQEQPGQCRPGFGTPAEHPPGGAIAFTSDAGYLVGAFFDSVTRQSLVYWGKSRETVGIESPNPMIWWGPEAVLLADIRLTRMHVTSLGRRSIYLAGVIDSSGSPRLYWQSLPLAGSPLQDQLVGGAYRCTSEGLSATIQPYSRLVSLRNSYGDKSSRKDLQATTFGTTDLGTGLSGSPTRLAVYNRADASRVSTSWGSVQYVTTSPVQTITPTATAGYGLQQRIDFEAPDGRQATAANVKIPYLDSIRTTYWRVVPDARVRTLEVGYGDGYLNRPNAEDPTYDPDWVTARLEELMSAGTRTTVRDPWDNRFTVRLRQSFPREITLGTNPYGKSVKAALQLIRIAGPL